MLFRLSLLLAGCLFSDTKGVYLGIKCYSNSACFSSNSFCNLERQQCQCLPSHPLKFINDVTAYCLKTSKIGELCEFSRSCHFHDLNTVCNQQKQCVCKEGFKLKSSSMNRLVCLSGSDDDFKLVKDISSEEDDSDEDEKEEKGRSYEKDVLVPVIVGIVLGTLIVCGWSFAVCHLYLKKMEKRSRSRRRRVVKRMRLKEGVEATRRMAESSRVAVPFVSSYSLVTSFGERSSIDQNDTLNQSDLGPYSSAPEICRPKSYVQQSAIPLISPDEEPLPGYDVSPSKDSLNDAPPSYNEVIGQVEEETQLVEHV